MSELVPAVYRTGPAATLIQRDVITASGPETEAFLQGQLSQDVAALDVGEAKPSFLLQPMGKVDAWLRVRRLADDSFALDVDAGYGEATLTRLNRFKLRTKCDLTLETLTVKAVRSTSAVEAPDGSVAVVWSTITGYDVVGSEALDAGEIEASAADYETLRLLVGIPAMGSELTEDTIPAEAGVVDESVSFTKGCYTGQELVARIDSRGGNVPKHLRAITSDGTLGVGDVVIVDGDEVGTITSAAGGVGLAYIKRAVESFPASAVAGGVSVEIRELPLV